MRCLSLLLICAFATPLPAQDTPQTGASAQNRAVVEGVIVNELTKEPIRRVEVRLMKVNTQPPGITVGPAAATNSVATDAEGKFRFENLEPGNYHISYQKQGFLGTRQSSGFSAPGTATITVAEGLELKGLRYSLTPQGVIAGRVLDDEGEPVQGVYVFVMTKRYVRGQRQWTPANGQPTNDRGEFRVPNLSPGAYVLSVQPGIGPSVMQASPAGDAQPRMGYVATYYPGVTSTSEAAPIEVKAGAEITNVDIPLRKRQVFSIRGSALDEHGKPLTSPPGFFVTLVPEGGVGMIANGRMSMLKGNEFQISNVTPGRYNMVLRVQQSGFESMPTGVQPVEVSNGDVEGVAIQMRRGATISGMVVIEGPGEKPAVTGTQVQLMPVDDVARLVPGRLMSPAKEDGSFSIGNVNPGRYLVLTSGPALATTYRAGVQGSAGLSNAGVVDVSGTDVTNLRVFLRTGPPRLTGTVEGLKDGGEPRTLRAVLRSTDKEIFDAVGPGLEMTMAVSPMGAFEFRNQPPGEYKLWVFRDYEYGALNNEDIFKKVASAAVTVNLQAGQTTNVSAKIIDMPRE